MSAATSHQQASVNAECAASEAETEALWLKFGLEELAAMEEEVAKLLARPGESREDFAVKLGATTRLEGDSLLRLYKLEN